MRTHSRTGAVAVVLAAGKGTRVGAEGNKAYLPLAGRRMVSWTLESLSQVPELARTVLVIRPEERKRAEQTVDREAPDLDVEIIEGGNSRHETIASARRASRGISSGNASGSPSTMVIGMPVRRA